jgi:septal ring factor EnvC (AmiA/AmiB activator)
MPAPGSVAVALLAATFAAGQPLAAIAQTTSETRHRLDDTQRQLSERRETEKDLAADVGRIEADRRQLNQSLVELAQAIQQGETRLTAIEGRLGGLEDQERFVRGSLAERHGSISRLLGAMQRMGRNPPPVVITRREDALAMVRSAMVLAAAFPQIRQQALTLATELQDLGRIIGETRNEGERLRAETQRLADQRIRLASLLEEKRQSLADRQQALDRVRRETADIARSVTDLSDLIARLDKVVTPRPEADAQSQGQGPAVSAAEKPAPEPERQVALASPAATAPPRIAPTPDVTLAPANRSLASFNPGRIKPAIPFGQTKGRLPLPASGKRIISFGDKAQTNRSNGIVIETRAAAQVTAPADGWIAFAGVFRSYGQILIINADDGYHILLAGLSRIDVQLGQFVLAGEPVGVMSGTQRDSNGGQTPAAPVLYVEFRKDGRAIDPDPWWANGT